MLTIQKGVIKVTQEKVKNSDKNQQMLIIGGIVVIALVIFAAVLVVASPDTKALEYADVIAEQDDSGEYIRPTDDKPFITAERTDDGAFVIGNPDAAVTIVAFEDFLCPHCQSYQSTVKQFMQDYVFTGKARFEFRMLPISQQSGFVFALVECAAEDDLAAFWAAHDEMFALTSTSGASFDGSDFAESIDASYSSLLDCAETANQYQADQALAAQYSGQITGTPAVAWRLNDSELRLDVISRGPSADELAALVEVFGQQ